MYKQKFPALQEDDYSIESPQTHDYNCIAWAAGSDTEWWWPDEIYYWPDGLPLKEDVETFKLMFVQLGYSACSNADFEEGFEKVAIYAIGDNVKHAARQLTNGRWTSKLGASHDIEHSPEGLEGDFYGNVVSILSRRIFAPL
jgi:hypothetical protein